MKLPIDIKTKWLDALRSGKYQQCERTIRKGNSFCCLGVLYAVMNGTENWPAYLVIYGKLPLEDGTQRRLIDLNDTLHKSFAEIADYIEREL